MLCSWLVPKKDASHWAGLLNPLVLASTHIFIPSYSFSVDSPAVFSSFLFHFVCQSINLFVGCQIQIDQILLWPVTQKWQSNCVNVRRKDFSVFGRCSCFLPAVWTFLNSILTTASDQLSWCIFPKIHESCKTSIWRNYALLVIPFSRFGFHD